MKKRYYHGTSYDNLESILQYGLRGDERKLWNVSQDYVYAWDAANLLATEYDECDPDENRVLDMGMQWAFDSAQFAMANAQCCRAVIIEFEADPNTMNPDSSCENMEGAFETERVTPDQITRIFVSNDLSLLRFYFIKMHLHRDMSAVDFDPAVIKLVEAIETEINMEDVESIVEWEEYPIPVEIKAAS